MEADLEQLLSALNAHNVRYVVVGGYDIAVHAQPRATKDLDVFIARTPENARSVYRALAAYGAPLTGITPEDFENPTSILRLGVPPIAVDILQQRRRTGRQISVRKCHRWLVGVPQEWRRSKVSRAAAERRSGARSWMFAPQLFG